MHLQSNNRTKSLNPHRTTDLPKSLSDLDRDSENVRLVNFALNATPSYVLLYDEVFPESCVTSDATIKKHFFLKHHLIKTAQKVFFTIFFIFMHCFLIFYHYYQNTIILGYKQLPAIL